MGHLRVLMMGMMLAGCATELRGTCETREDCDGRQICAAGWCVRDPTTSADAGASPTVCRPEAERCNGVDDDCDDVVDEDSGGAVCFSDGTEALPRTSVDVGPCRAGTLRCRGGVSHCDGLVVPRPGDPCGGGDEDCDGIADEDGPIDEVCNQRDDDCDGSTDEGHWPPERCDGIDNDCDGIVDDDTFGLGQTCFVDPSNPKRIVEPEERRGACAKGGRLVCAAGRLRCEGLILPRRREGASGDPETCNGRDDDCDGVIDEDFVAGIECGADALGECRRPGRATCVDGTLICTDPDGTRVQPGEPDFEVCDGLDDDCDGVADNACACAEGEQSVLDGFGSRRGTLPLVSAASPPGLEGSCTAAGGDASASPRNEAVIRWVPATASTSLALIRVTADDFDPLVYLRSPCYPTALRDQAEGQEQGCALDSGTDLAEGAPTLMVTVPRGSDHASIVVEPEGVAAEDAAFTVQVLDPTYRSVVGPAESGHKQLTIGGVHYSDGRTCRKRIVDLSQPLPRFQVIPAAGDDPGWMTRTVCIDNDGWHRSVEVSWQDLVRGVGAHMLPAAALEAGDWWSVEVPGDIAAGFDILLEPANIASRCAANTVRLRALLTCTARPPFAMSHGACTSLGPSRLSCASDGDDLAQSSCEADVIEDTTVPVRHLDLHNLFDGSCRGNGAGLVLHIGVIRTASAPKIGCWDGRYVVCGDEQGAGEAVPAPNGFDYRLRVQLPD